MTTHIPNFINNEALEPKVQPIVVHTLHKDQAKRDYLEMAIFKSAVVVNTVS